ncbi:MAG: GNAT family N-acetyltransferase [Beijerinckiaceae bacterium]
MTPAIRDATQTDIPALAKLAADAYRATFLPIIGETGLALRTPAFFAGRFADEWPHIRLADRPGDILGFAEVRQGMLDMLFVRPGLTGRGIGVALLRDAEARGAVKLECFEENRDARRFYAREGWRETTTHERDFAGGRYRFVMFAKA